MTEHLSTTPELRGQAFNVSHEIQVSVQDVVQRVLALMKSSLKPDVRNEASHEIRHQWLNAGKARRLLAWKPAYGLDEGLKETIAWYETFLRETS